MTISVGALKQRAANAVQSALGRRGFQLTRPRFHEENEIDVRALLLQPIEATRRPVILQIGAGDGVQNDPVHDDVVARGWRLFAVEPIPAAFERLQETYYGCEHVTCIRAAVGEADGTATLFTIRQDGPVDGFDYDQFSSLARDVVATHWRYVPDLESRIEQIDVPTVSFMSLLRDHDIPPVDLLQIDTEGYDWRILEQAFAAGIEPPVVAFEWTHLTQAEMWACRTELIGRGYRWLVSKGDVIASRMPLGPPGEAGQA